MATATFRFHGDFGELLARERRGVTFTAACARAATLKHAIESLGVPHTEAARLTVNGQPATLSRIVREGDAIEVFPHESGALDEAPLFFADAHLGGLARLLRMLGIDTAHDPLLHDRDIVTLAGRERRVVLTRDRELLKCRELLRGCFVHAIKPEAQLREVAGRYAINRHLCPFTLCLHCNLRLEAVDQREVAGQVPASIAQRYAEFARCAGCGRIFWQGTHWERMRAMLNASLGVHL